MFHRRHRLTFAALPSTMPRRHRHRLALAALPSCLPQWLTSSFVTSFWNDSLRNNSLLNNTPRGNSLARPPIMRIAHIRTHKDT